MLADLFAEGGALHQAKAAEGKDYQYRKGQVQMALGVEDAQHDEATLVVEAPTGVGKSAAYLIPALAAGRRLIVSTGTKILQDQLLGDRALMERTIGRPVDMVTLKGRSNYGCNRRIAETHATNPADEAVLDRVREWATFTTLGEIDEVDELPPDVRAQVTTDRHGCTGAKCDWYEECFTERAKARARDADVVLVNHTLLVLDGLVRTATGGHGGVLPPTRVDVRRTKSPDDDPHVVDLDSDIVPGVDPDTVDHLVIDEAHTLEDRATSALGADVTLRRWTDIVRLLERGQFARLSTWGDSEALTRVTDRFAAALARVDARILGARAVLLGDERPLFGRTVTDFDGVLADLTALKEPNDELAEARSHLASLRNDLAWVITPVDPPTHARSADRQGQGRYQRVVLHADPVDVAGPLARLVWSRYASVVATSATLTAAGSFDYWTGSVGLVHPRTLICPSPFVFQRAARLYVPYDTDPFLPTSADRERYFDRIAQEMLALVDLTRGRALLLFTSYTAMHAVEERLAREAGDFYEILLHGRDGTPAALVDRLRHPRERPVVLLGTRTFWEGVDIPGPALSLVAIDKLPFASPDDPLEQARSAVAGDTPFTTRSVPAATMLTKQAVGRLIRSTTDRGIIAILDTRLRTKSYGPGIVHSLPPAIYVGKLSQVEDFVDRWED